MPENGLICHNLDGFGVRIQCVSRVYPGVYPGCIQGAAGGVSRRGVNRVAEGLQPSSSDQRAWMCQIHHKYTISTPMDTP